MCVSLLCGAMWWGSYVRKWSMHVACVGWCAGLKMGSYGSSNSVKESVRRWQDSSEELVQSPWKFPPRMMRWLGYVVVSVLRAKQASSVFARSWGR